MTLNLTQQTNHLAWHFGPWCCITIPSLVTDDSAAEEISSTWTFTGILNHFCDLDHGHNRAIQSFHKTVLLMMMYHQTKFSCKKISSSDNKFRSYILIITPLTVTLTLNTTIQLFHKTLWFMIMYYQTKFGSKRISNSKDTMEIFIFDHMSTCNDPYLENRKSIFSHDNLTHNDESQYQGWKKKKLDGLEDIIWTNINILTLCCDLDPECSNSIFFIAHSSF